MDEQTTTESGGQEEISNARRELVKYATLSDEVPKTYANGLIVFLGNSDIGIVLQLHGQPIGVINISHGLAKTLQEKLGNLISELERDCGHEVISTLMADKAFKSTR